MRPAPRGIGPKINLGLIAFVVLLGAAMAGVLVWGFQRTKDNASARSQEGLELFAERTLQTFAVQLADSANRTITDMSNAGQQAAQVMEGMRRTGGAPPWDGRSLTVAPGGQRFDSTPGRISDAWAPAVVPSEAAVQADLRDSAALDAAFPGLKSRDEEMIAMYFIGTSGALRYYPPTDIGGIVDAGFSPTETQAYVNAAPAANPERGPVWIEPHQSFARKGMVYTVSTPIYDGDVFRGVLAVDVPQKVYIDAVDSTKPADVGFAFAIDDSGELIPSDTAPIVRDAVEAGNAPLGGIIQTMRQHTLGVEHAELDGKEYIISYAPINGIGGSLALAAPLDAMTAVGDAQGIRESINREGNRTVVLTLATMGLLLVAALAAAAWLNRRLLLLPIARLVEGTRIVAGGNLEAAIPVETDDELGDLAESFNEMTTMLRRREQLLQGEIVERERAENELAALFAAMTDIVIVIDREGRHLRVAPTSKQSFVDPARLVGASVHEYFGPEVSERVLDTIRRTLETRTTQEMEYPATLGDEKFWLSGSASALTDDSVVWVVRNITEMVQSRQLLEERVAEQRQQLSTLLAVSQTVISTLELQPLVDVILSQLRTAVPCMGISLLVQHGEKLLLLDSAEALPAAGGRPANPLLSFRRDDVNAIWKSFDRGEPVVIGNIRGEEPLAEAFRTLDGMDMAMFSEVGSVLAVPLYMDEQAFGAIALSRPEGESFTNREAQLAMAFASHAALAIENADMLAQSERRARENEALSRIAASLTFDRPMEATLDAVASIVVEATHAQACGVIVMDEDTGELRLGGSSGLPEGYTEAVERALSSGTASTSKEAMASGTPTVIATGRTQMLAETRYTPLRELLEEVTWEVVVVVPMLYRGTPVGALNVCYAAAEEPGEEERAFLNTIADQAAVAVQDVGLFREAQRRAAENETLSRAASSLTFDQPLEVTFDSLAERAVEASRAVACAVILRDEETGMPHMAGTHGMPDSYAADMDAAWRAGARTSALDVFATGKLHMWRNGRERVLGDDRFAPIQRYWEDPAWDTAALVPLNYRGRILGALCCYYAPGVEPSQREVALLGAVADQTAVAVENARLFSHSGSRVRELEAVAQIASNFTFQQPLESMMDAVAEQIVQATQALACGVSLADPESLRTTRLAGAAGLPPGFRDALESGWRAGTRTMTSRPLRTGETLVIEDGRRTALGVPGYERALELVADAKWDTIIMVPMIYQTHPVGLLIVCYPQAVTPSRDEMAFIRAIADQAAVAAENARLFSQAQSVAVVEERQRLSRELHDSVSQALYGISLGSQTARELLDTDDPRRAAEPMEYVLSLAEAGIAEMRALIFELRPEALEAEGLLGALKKQAASVRARHGVAVEAQFGPEPEMPQEGKEVLYRIAQEALHNMVKHANATEAQLRLSVGQGEVLLEVTDNGSGFEVADDYPGHLGLKSMRERVLHLGGQVRIESAPGEGTSIRARLPLSE